MRILRQQAGIGFAPIGMSARLQQRAALRYIPAVDRPSDVPARRRGIALLRQGHVAQAESCFRDALRAQPDAPELHATLGAILAAQGRAAEALASFHTALQLRPDSAEAHGNLGNALRELGRPDEAERHLREALRLRPAYPEAYNNLGAVLRDRGEAAEAEECLREALRLRPDFVQSHGNLGHLLLAAGRAAEAAHQLSAALRGRPDDAGLLSALGAALRAIGRLHEAEAATRQALRLVPTLTEARIELGNVLYELGRAAEARDAFRAAREQNPNSAPALLGIGVAGIVLGLFDEAEAALRAALAQQASFAEAHNALGDLLRNRGRLEESEAALREALRLRPDYPDAQVNLAFTLLQAGRFADGWRAHEHRFQANAWRGHKHDFSVPRWQGEPLAGRRLLIHSEQGLGDVLQFCRHLSRIEMGAYVIVRVQTPLVRLLAASFPALHVVAQNEPLPPFDLECPLLSLPHVLGQDPLRAAPYLVADPALASTWRRWVDQLPGRRVGLVWAGNPRLAADARRSIPLAALAPLGDIGGISFVSLQHGPAASQQAPSGFSLHDRTGDLNDFADTAALVSALDLVIGVDTAVIHLAGALGRTVWLLNRADTCWRWLARANSSTLYPSLREFRQDSPGDWGGAITEVQQALAHIGRSATHF
jgi:Flp pilus assembly protein TadD